MKSAASVWTLALAVWLTVLLDHTSADVFGSGDNQFSIDFVTIGNPGNPDDTDTTGSPRPAGKVEYAYRMGKYEISQGMIEKATASGMTNVTTGPWAAAQPATNVSWYEAASFVNWLNTSKGYQAAYDVTWTGTSWSMALWNSSNAWQKGGDNRFRHKDAHYFLPSADEWYKAAYYDSTAGVYYDYPTGSNRVPRGIDSAGDTTFDAVFWRYFDQGGPNDIINVGVLSPYGTAGQGGNVFEWEETEFDLVNDSSSSVRGFRGGFWRSGAYQIQPGAGSYLFGGLSVRDRLYANPAAESGSIGFRVASIPEPSTLFLGALGATGLLLWRRWFTESKTTRFAALLWAALLMPSVVQAVTIETVPVGNPGNAPDMRYNLDQRPEGYGAVPYRYRIGKYEVTAGQYTEFLNAVAAEDTNGLYNESMDADTGSSFGCNIKRMGDPGSYTYSVAADWADRPVNYVSFWDAARFANWLHNGQPTGPQGPGTTEDGAYHDVGDQSLFGRNPGARYFIPTEGEWYKAAYHDKGAGLAASYFDYPTGTDAVPGNDPTEATNPGNNANYYISDFAIGPPYYRTVGGEFELSDSPYGTFDQGGNVWEWNETVLFDDDRGLRGGSFDGSYSLTLPAASRLLGDPSFEYYLFIGIRVASIPEPGSLTLCVVGVMMMMLYRGKK